MHKRPGNNPKRRIAPVDCLNESQKRALIAKVKYVGSGHHKRHPADYAMERTNPRPTKSLCDAVRKILLKEAQELLESGILRGMFSMPSDDGFPKYVWSVSLTGDVYESKTDPSTPGDYHGYPLENEDDMREYVRDIWSERCQKI